MTQRNWKLSLESDPEPQDIYEWMCKPKKLINICLLKVAQFLILGCYKIKPFDRLAKDENSRNVNPLNIPRNLVKLLFRLVFSLTHPNIPNQVAIRPLLMCCLDVIDFRYLCTYPNLENLNNIIETLIFYADSIEILSITSNGGYNCIDLPKVLSFDKGVHSDLYINLTELIRRCQNLKKLKVDFLFDNRVLLELPDIIELDLEFLNQDWKVHEFHREFRLRTKLNMILKLPKLNYFNMGELDIFEHFADDELPHVPLPKTSQIKSLKFDKVRIRIFKLIERLFPDLTDIHLCINRHTRDEYLELKKYLSKYKLHIYGNYVPSHQRFFVTYASGITDLQMGFVRITQMEFFRIVHLLPNLLFLDVKYICICKSNQNLLDSDLIVESAIRVISNLKELKLICCRCGYYYYKLYQNFLKIVLQSCWMLERLVVEYSGLDDTIMYSVIDKNNFYFIKEIILCCCNLSEQFVIDLTFFTKSLEYIKVSEYEYGTQNLVFDDKALSLKNAVQLYNPYLIVDV